MNMSNLYIETFKEDLKKAIKAVRKDKELRNLLSELIDLASGTKSSSSPQKKKLADVDINPISLTANEGIDRLEEELNKLEVEDLIALIKKYGLDRTRKSYKWKTKNKLIEFIKEKVSSSATRGDVFSIKDKSL